LFGQARITHCERCDGKAREGSCNDYEDRWCGREVLGRGDSGETPRIFNVAPGVYKMIFVSWSGVTKIVENVRVDEGGEAAKEVTF